MERARVRRRGGWIPRSGRGVEGPGRLLAEGQPVGHLPMSARDEQELFWMCEFGDDYSARNSEPRWLASNTALFARILSRTCQVSSIIELGANVGPNLRSLDSLFPSARMSAVEINEKAAAELRAHLPRPTVFHGSLLDSQPGQSWDLAVT